MTAAVVVGALVLAGVNAVPALVGSWNWHRGQAGGAFWTLLRAGQGAAVALAVWVGVLALLGRYSSDRLFYLYALLPLAISFIAEQLRLTSAQMVLDREGLADAQAVGDLPEHEQHQIVEAIVRREMGVMTLAAVVVLFLALRAAGTAHGF